MQRLLARDAWQLTMTTSWVRPAVEIDPREFDDTADLRRDVARALDAAGIGEALWFETTAEDPGRGQCADALAAGADLVLACGGDGTVRACAAALAGGDVPLGLLPAGTGDGGAGFDTQLLSGRPTRSRAASAGRPTRSLVHARCAMSSR